MNKALIIGIDGGATHSTAVAAWNDGTVAAVEYGDGLNFNNVGTETVRRRIEDIVNRICESTGASVDCVCIGSAALDMPADAQTAAKFTGLLNAQQLDLQSDAYIALMGLTQGRPGMIAICGTGSMLLLADNNGKQHVSGGWGYLMDDAGSGYAIAREGLLAAISEYEDTGLPTPITQHACSYFETSDLRDIIGRIYAPDFTPDMLAGFARCVLEAAEKGDIISRIIIERSMTKLAYQAAALFKKAPDVEHIGLYGGIFAHSPIACAAFEKTLKINMPNAVICTPEYPPELGAIIHILQKRGILDDQVLKNLKETYGRIKK